MTGRTKFVVITDEARVLKHLRERAKLSMKEAGERLGRSGSLISQIENGRENPPKGERLLKFLAIYEVSLVAYNKLVRDWAGKLSDESAIIELLPKLKAGQKKMVRSLIEQMAKDSYSSPGY